MDDNKISTTYNYYWQWIFIINYTITSWCTNITHKIIFNECSNNNGWS